jgi:hypothetical protein
MSYVKILSLLCVSVLLMACNSSSSSHSSPSSPPPPPPLDLTQFAIIDSYGLDSGLFPDDELYLDPYAYEGVFEVYWDVTPNRDYSFYLSVGPTPDIADSITLYDAMCGPGLVCARTGYEVCDYTLDYELQCANQAPVDVSSWIYEVPQSLYLFAEVCGPYECDAQRLGVLAL